MKAAVMGYGTVGKGVCEILTEKEKLFPERCGNNEICLGKVLDIKDLSASPVADKWTKNIDDILNDGEIKVVVETMGGVHPAFEFCKRCIEAGKSVVTSNKQLVAEKGEELFEAAERNNVSFRFGASVCGGIPVIRTIFYGLAGNEIRSFSGILNGTTNFILTKMIKEKSSFDAALDLAQKLGYAERDPSADVDGFDAARKTAILASAAFGSHISPDDIHTEGITGITLEDVAYVDSFGGKIKLLGRAQKLENGRIYAMVSPAVVDNSSLLASVEGVYNALKITGDKIGDILLYGQGAGKDATASAVVADVLDCIRLKGFDKTYCWKKREEDAVAPYGEKELRLYVRGFSANVKNAVSDIRENIDGVEVLTRDKAPENETAFVTGKAREKDLRELIAGIKDFAAASIIRIEE